MIFQYLIQKHFGQQKCQIWNFKRNFLTFFYFNHCPLDIPEALAKNRELPVNKLSVQALFISYYIKIILTGEDLDFDYIVGERLFIYNLKFQGENNSGSNYEMCNKWLFTDTNQDFVKPAKSWSIGFTKCIEFTYK